MTKVKTQYNAKGAAITSLILKVFQTNGRILRAGDRLIGDLAVTSARWQVIGAITQRPKTVSQIARDYELTRQAILWVVKSMVKDGIVELTHNPDHRRAKLVQLTKSGQRIQKVIDERQREWANKIAEDFTLDEIVETERQIARLGDVVMDGDPRID